ncbi:MAG: hypothetical protein M1829_004756 [Trizodia sp. TS-e1964]|nr:MAG: hypothetical protein M1829_004756 [Trizodia sp. TS-e1964]
MPVKQSHDTRIIVGTSRGTFEERRAALIGSITGTMGFILRDINSLNRSVENVVTLGSDLTASLALWSEFEKSMAPRDAKGEAEDEEAGMGEGLEEGDKTGEAEKKSKA